MRMWWVESGLCLYMINGLHRILCIDLTQERPSFRSRLMLHGLMRYAVLHRKQTLHTHILHLGQRLKTVELVAGRGVCK